MPTWVEKWSVASTSRPDMVYTVAVDRDGHYGCSCPAWKFQRRECKHIQKIKEKIRRGQNPSLPERKEGQWYL